MYIKRQLYNLDLSWYVTPMVVDYYLMKIKSTQLKYVRYIYWHVRSEGLKWGKTKQYSQNVYQMTIVQSRFGFICETGGGKVLLGEPLSPHNSNMWDIFIWMYDQWWVEMSKNYIELTKWLSNGNCTTSNWLHMWNQWWYIIAWGSLTFFLMFRNFEYPSLF